MDDFPAEPASPGPRWPALSVVIPVHNGGRDFETCLRGLRDSTHADFELIVVDDGSTDDSGGLARSFGATVIRREQAEGPASARNAGALAAKAPLIFFLDADVRPHPDAIGRAVARFDADPALAALFGSYDDAPTDPGAVSQFRNLLHHFVHQAGTFVDDARPARTFWTGCGAIRRRVFLDLGGFDPRRYKRPAIEDIELGYRMAEAGHAIRLARDVRGTHLKRWTLGGVIRTDIMCRGVPWMLLMKRSRIAETDLNVGRSQKLSVAAAGVLAMALLASIAMPAMLGVAAMGLALVAYLNRRFYIFLAKCRGVGFLAAALPLHLVYFGCCGASVLIAWAIWYGSMFQARSSARTATAGRLDRARAAVPGPTRARAAQPKARA